MKKFLLLIFFMLTSTVYAGNLPDGYKYRVLNNSPYTWQTFTFQFTPSITGSQYIMFAFRQDPAYWRMKNVVVTAPGNSTNLVTNGNMATGGSLQVQTANYGEMTINAPTNWGVSYQAGYYPAAAGTWMNGMWYDGAVGSYDGIYQGVNLVAGVTYTVSFDVNGDNTSTTTTDGWQLAVYTGSCADTTLNPAQCMMPSSSGFQTVASPGSTSTAGCGNSCAPPEPTYPPATISNAQQNKINQTSQLGRNSIYIDNIGNYNSYTIEQKSDFNAVRGINRTSAMSVNGSFNNFNINQGTAGSLAGQNLAEIAVIGANNALNLTQTHDRKYTEININGSNNSLNLTQSDPGQKSAFINVTSNSNTLTISQSGSGNHFVDVSVPNGNSNVNITQSGAAQKMFSLTLNNSNIGVTVVQDSPTATDSAAMSISCTTGSCSGYTYTRH
jgi:hypothetical protein